MTSLDQNAPNRPDANASGAVASADPAGPGAGHGSALSGSDLDGSADADADGHRAPDARDGTAAGLPAVPGPARDADGLRPSGAENVVPGVTGGMGMAAGSTGTPGSPGWSSGAWGAGAVAGRTRLPRRPTPSRRLSQVRAVPPASAPFGGTAPTGLVAAEVETLPAAPVGVPMGVLIGGSPGPIDSAGPGVARVAERRVSARLLRFGSGTCQVVLPEWRPAIAVSVPTEQLQRSTGMSPEELRSALLSVVINPEAVHDRELGLRDWQAEVPAARGRRRGRRQVR
ncbi:hypothetical protein ACIQF6_27875 [Kitasatospora sp. NPDC092948]|uniref:hypothetical protein n=1 Tax=Kitasatospora sp. NPDC092948 TaxID=3364088 RepID=UPI003813FCC3